MNQVNLIGRVGSDVELKFTPSGKEVAEINLAVDDGWGENKKTAWIGVTLWGKTAEIAGKYVHKGDQVAITGRLTQDEWEDKTTGKKQRKTKVTASELHLLSNGKQGDRPRSEGKPAPKPEHDSREFLSTSDSDVPW